MPPVVAIVVTYHPCLETLTGLLDVLGGQVDWLVIVDNGSGLSLKTYLEDRGRAQEQLIALPTNLGVATAQNRGIAQARKLGASYIALFDQDSIPSHDMIPRLLKIAQEKVAAGIPLAAVGPRIMDRLTPQPRAHLAQIKNTVLLVDNLMASGCLIPLAALDHVGDMADELFIDFIDIEWGLRAKHHGLQSFLVESLNLTHRLGDQPLRFMGRNVMVHTPLRHYYMFRNALWMYRQGWLPLPWKLRSAGRMVIKYVFYSLFAKPQYCHWKMMTLGLWHGLRGKVGSLDNAQK